MRGISPLHRNWTCIFGEGMKDRNLFITSIIFFVLYLIFIIGIFTPLKGIFMPFVTAFAFVYFLSPAVNFFKNFKINPVVSTLVIYALIICALCFSVLFAIPTVYEAVLKIWDLLSVYFEKINTNGADFFSMGAEKAYSTAMGLVKTGTVVVIGAVAAFYILTDKKEIVDSLKEFIPLDLKPSFKILIDDIKASLDSFFKGQFLIALILFVIDAVFLYAAGVPYAAGLGAIAAILDIIPYVGATVGIGIIMAVCFVSCPDKLILVIIGLLIIQQIENNIISPKISSDTMELHPSVIVLVLYIGAFGGFWGILLALPLSSIFCKIFKRLIQSII